VETKSGMLRRILIANRSLWDCESTKAHIRRNFQKVIDCRTRALGAVVYDTASGERMLRYNTCKCRSCPSCGYWSTIRWQAKVAAFLPDTNFCNVVFTMPPEFWKIFKMNKHLLHDLPAIGAGVLQDWAMDKFGAEIAALVFCHTFGYALEFKPHLHILVSSTGLRARGSKLVRALYFPRDMIRERWRASLLQYVAQALKEGKLSTDLSSLEFADLLEENRYRWWNVGSEANVPKFRVVKYLSRYLRRLPIAESHIEYFNNNQVRIWTKDTKEHRQVAVDLSDRELINRISDHQWEHYQHAVRYFGLLAPRSINTRLRLFLRCLGQVCRNRPRQLRWADSIRKHYLRDPLLSKNGERYFQVGVLPPKRD